MLWRLYGIAGAVLGPPVFLSLALSGRYGGSWRQRLGLDPSLGGGPEPRVWFHGASVGEIKSAGVLIDSFKKLRPEAAVALSSVTPAGLVAAADVERAHPGLRTLAAPWDFWGAPGRTLRHLRPAALVIMETELWPGLIRAASKAGARLMLAAGRMTDRSYRRYRLIGKSMARLLSLFDLVAVIGKTEYDYYADLGVPAARLIISGNPKFDALLAESRAPDSGLSPAALAWRRRLWADRAPGPLLVAGSTHEGEEALALDYFQTKAAECPELTLILAPRHLKRAAGLLEQAENRGFTARLTSQAADKPLALEARVLILDSLGDLNHLYPLARAALVGGSLIKGHGHNPLEPAAVGVPVIFGSHMDSFSREAQGLLQADGAREAKNPAELASHLDAWLNSEEKARKSGAAARRYTASLNPAGPALAQALAELIQPAPDSRRGEAGKLRTAPKE